MAAPPPTLARLKGNPLSLLPSTVALALGTTTLLLAPVAPRVAQDDSCAAEFWAVADVPCGKRLKAALRVTTTS